MTVHLSSPRAKPRWLLLTLVVLAVSAIAVGFATAHGATTLPAGYVGSAQEDVHGGNDVPGQVDVTQMGRDNTEAPNLRIFWGWDSISAWTGSGQTGDACALFDDSDADAFIDYVVCARVQNVNSNPDNVGIVVAAANKPVFIFDCSNKKNDRCTNPVPRDYVVGDVVAGPLGSLSTAGTGNLISETDPFDANDVGGPGESHPHDSTIDIRIDDSLVPTGVGLVNVCSYPSAGNGGNNNPFDCIVTPGTQYGTLRIVKVLNFNNGATAGFTDFSYSVNGGSAVAFDADGVTESLVPTGNYSITESAPTGYTASYANNKNANANCTSLAVTVGATTTCTITNSDNAPSLTLVKQLNLNNGATDAASAWTLRANKTGTDTTTYELSGSTPASSDAGFDIGTYDLSETGPAGYTGSAWSCVKNGGAPVEGSSISLGLGDSATCTITNSDDPPGLTLIKNVINDNGLTNVATDWTLSATGAGGFTNAALSSITTEAGMSSSASTGSKVVTAGVTYTLSESATPTGYAAGSWVCTGGTQGLGADSNKITLALGESATCRILNNDVIATPSFATDVDAQIRDNVKITGRGIPSGTVDFFLYSDSACTELVGSDLNVALNANGDATSKYFNVTASDTYYWQVHYDGNQNNAAATGSCGEAIKVESADFASVLTAGGGVALPLLVWAAWSRRRRAQI